MRLHIRPGVRRLFRLAPRTTAAARADIDDELESLIASRVDALVAQGLSPDDARAEAVRRLGVSFTEVRRQLHHFADQQERRMRFRDHIESLAQDLRYAARGLARRPAFTAVAVITLAIGIGATTAIFSAVNVMILRALPYARPDELMNVSLTVPQRGKMHGAPHMSWSYPKFVFFRDHQQTFSDVAAFSSRPVVITSGDVERASAEVVSATYLRTLGISPIIGRDFDRSLDARGGAPTQVIIGAQFWERRYHSDPRIIGRTISIERRPFTIIGVTPAGFKGLWGGADLFMPVTALDTGELDQAQMHWLNVVARRKPALSAAQASAATAVLGRQVSDAFPDKVVNGSHWGAAAEPLDWGRIAPVVRQSLLVLFGAVALVLLIACVNVANLQLGRTSARRREIAVRMAIGAGRGRLVRLLVTESLLLSLAGGAVAVVVAWIGTRALSAVAPDVVGYTSGALIGAVEFSPIQLDWPALAFAFALALGVGLVFGLAPALHATRTTLSHALKEGDADNERGIARSFTGRRVLVVVEVALSLVLLAGAGLMIRSLSKMLAVDEGFDPRNVLAIRLAIPGNTVADTAPEFYAHVIDRLRAVPGVTSASAGMCPPLFGGCNITVLWTGNRDPDPSHDPLVGGYWATPDYFRTLGIPLKQGRVFTDADRAGAPKVLLITETAARRIWPNENPIGKHVHVGCCGTGQGDGAEIVGIVGDIRQWVDSAPSPAFYVPIAQSSRPGIMLFVRSSRDLTSLTTDVRRAVKEIAPTFPVYSMQPLSAQVAAATARERYSATLLGLFAAIALSLAVVGIYGVMSLTVTARTREIGIRIALGADQRRVQRLVVGEGMALVAAGAVFGVAGAMLCTRVLQTMLFHLAPTDPVVYTAGVCLLGLTAFAASWLPARRASRVDPLEALRAE